MTTFPWVVQLLVVITLLLIYIHLGWSNDLMSEKYVLHMAECGNDNFSMGCSVISCNKFAIDLY